jgi:GH35 family endo-1,4-beta-xylanase
LARKYSNAELELREYSFEFGWAERKSKAFYQLVRHLINSQVPIGSVGLQCHIGGNDAFNVDKLNWNYLAYLIDRYKSLGLKVYLTEVDISPGSFKSTGFTQEAAANQKAVYKKLVDVAKQSGTDGIFFWGIADEKDPWWMVGHFPLIFDPAYKKKQAYFGIKEALQGI